MQWHKSSKNSKNDLIILAIFGVLKAATFNRSFYNELNTQQDVFNAIEDRLGHLKGAIKINLTETLSRSTRTTQTTQKQSSTIPPAPLPLSTSKSPVQLMRETIAKEMKSKKSLEPKQVKLHPVVKPETKEEEPKHTISTPRPSPAPKTSVHSLQKDHGVN
ncbi:hypothetical protein KA013_05285 [Patescibacteria group bacterium]|nr:hypothetical protein [Patescibacteria group bacterium]